MTDVNIKNNKRKILIWGGFYDNEAIDHALQLLSKGCELCEETDSELFLFGITDDRGRVDGIMLGNYNIVSCRVFVTFYENITAIAEETKKFTDEIKPDLIMVTASDTGKAVAAIMASSFGFGLTAECVDVTYNGTEFVFTRAAMNDSVLADIVCINCKTNMGTFKKGVWSVRESVSSGEYFEPEFVDGPSDNTEFTVLDVLEEIKPCVELSGAKVIFGIGRGVSNKNTRNKIREIANKYGFGFAVTRAALESYGYSRDIQIGQSGISVSPQIYVGFGISGACQHMVGLRNTPLIIAVNNDENAPIFDYAHYSVVADVDEIVDSFYNDVLGGAE